LIFITPWLINSPPPLPVSLSPLFFPVDETFLLILVRLTEPLRLVPRFSPAMIRWYRKPCLCYPPKPIDCDKLFSHLPLTRLFFRLPLDMRDLFGLFRESFFFFSFLRAFIEFTSPLLKILFVKDFGSPSFVRTSLYKAVK